MEQFASAYVRAVASVVGCSVLKPEVDNDSVDLMLSRRSPGAACRSPHLEVQLKATCAPLPTNQVINYRLPLKNYNDLRHVNLSVPRILVVVLMPHSFQDWTAHSEKQLALRRCGYWLSLRGFPSVSNKRSRTVPVPRGQRFDPSGLEGIFCRLEECGLP